jgi:hypothetical protein
MSKKYEVGYIIYVTVEATSREHASRVAYDVLNDATDGCYSMTHDSTEVAWAFNEGVS